MSHLITPERFLVQPAQRVNLKSAATDYHDNSLDKSEANDLLKKSQERLSEIQDKLYAHNRYRILIILQAMDAAGKDSTVKHIMSGFNPLGVNVYSFKTPTAHELDHDYFWRHYQALPARGEIAIHNRSHYENVLVTKVHPEYILNENLPGIKTVSDINDSFWQRRYEQINNFEKNLYENGTIILKFFLHVSKKEQRKRFLERIDDPSKNWKFSLGDLTERKFWDQYQQAYEDALSLTSMHHAPWYIIPADTKWFARVVIAEIICHHLSKLNIHYPELNEKQKAALQDARNILMSEPD